MNVTKTELYDVDGHPLDAPPGKGEYYTKQTGYQWLRTVVGYKTSEVSHHPVISRGEIL